MLTLSLVSGDLYLENIKGNEITQLFAPRPYLCLSGVTEF